VHDAYVPRGESTHGTAVDRAVCVECGCLSDELWTAWRAYRVDDPEVDAIPELGLFCPDCAGREFGRH
jgi:hypothetical protein